ncbi:hypothetical protein [Streptomyces sp. NPDC004065]|uniref:hypothetical protein n=1 Tax=Streptomyces sp. NPDC004065 TaxID=3364689 RepID=UPI003850FAEB
MKLRWITGCAVVPTLLLTACTSDTDAEPWHAFSPTATHRTTQADTEKRLTAAARSALDGVTDEGASMVESGVERVSDGVHTQLGLTQGTTYKLTVVCAGKGTVRITLAPAAAGEKKPIPCDQSIAFERIKPKAASAHLDIVGNPGASGMIAWRVNKM